MDAAPSAQFLRSVAANLGYWQQQARQADDAGLLLAEQDRRNLVRAAEFGLQPAETWHQAAELLLQSFHQMSGRGYWQEWIPLLEQARARCQPEDTALVGRLLDHLGIFYRHNWQLDKAILIHQEEERLGRQHQDEWRLAHARLNLSEALRLSRHYEAAEAYGRAALAGFEAVQAGADKHAFTCLSLGLIAQARGDRSQAETWLRQSVGLWRQVGQTAELANALINLANTVAASDAAAALAFFQEAAALLAAGGDELKQIDVDLALGTLYFNEGQLAEAEAAFNHADRPFLRAAGKTLYRAIIANNLGNVFLAQGRLAEAETQLKTAVRLFEIVEDPVQLANALGTLAGVRLGQGDAPAARELYDEALSRLAAFPDDAWARSLLATFSDEQRRLETTATAGA